MPVHSTTRFTKEFAQNFNIENFKHVLKVFLQLIIRKTRNKNFKL